MIMKNIELLFILFLVISGIVRSAPDNLTFHLAKTCYPSLCQLPDCYCGGTRIPGNLSPRQIPQFVLLTFDDAVNKPNYDLYKQIFKNRKNPNGCPIKATFYVSHEWTDYGQVQDLYAAGHEIASHTISHRDGSTFTEEEWADEVIGQAEMLVKFSHINPSDIKGVRTPFLAVGGDSMFTMLNRHGFLYDSSMSVNSPSWPYTLNYKIPHRCAVPVCPKYSHPSVWEIPLNTFKDLRGGFCSMADACYYEDNVESILETFITNFNEYYYHHRAPFPLFFHAAWFQGRLSRKTAFLNFLDEILKRQDVYFVTSQELINWTRFPQNLNQTSTFLKCETSGRPKPCDNSKTTCFHFFKGTLQRIPTCAGSCPNSNPFIKTLLASVEN